MTDAYQNLTDFFGLELLTDMVAAPSEVISSTPHRYSDEAAANRRLTQFKLDIAEATRIEDRRAVKAWCPRRA